MFYGVVLFLHIFVACATIAVIARAAHAMVTNNVGVYKRIAAHLAAVATLQVGSGVLLIALSPALSVTKVGMHLAVYLSICLAVEGMLYLKAKRTAWTS